MVNKMTAEQGKKIKDLQEGIRKLQLEINEKEVEVDHVLIEAGVDFEGSYVEFYNGIDYIFMKVEKQIIRDGGTTIHLQGPSIRLCDSPLHEDYDEDGLDTAYFYEEDGFVFTPKVLEGHSFETIRRISKRDMITVLDYCVNALKKNLL